MLVEPDSPLPVVGLFGEVTAVAAPDLRRPHAIFRVVPQELPPGDMADVDGALGVVLVDARVGFPRATLDVHSRLCRQAYARCGVERSAAISDVVNHLCKRMSTFLAQACATLRLRNEDRASF